MVAVEGVQVIVLVVLIHVPVLVMDVLDVLDVVLVAKMLAPQSAAILVKTIAITLVKQAVL